MIGSPPGSFPPDDTPDFLRPPAEDAAHGGGWGSKSTPFTWGVVVGVVMVFIAASCLFLPWVLLSRTGTTTGTQAQQAPRGQQQLPQPDPTVAKLKPLPAGSEVLGISIAFTSQLRQTTGSARLVRLNDGKVKLYIDDLSTSDGVQPLKVWLTDQGRVEGLGEKAWSIFDDGRVVDLGELQSTAGDQVYDVPAGTELKGLRSVAIWCEVVTAAFGVAHFNGVLLDVPPAG